jgi:proteasome accessory factor C
MAKITTEDRLARILAMVPWVVAHDGPSIKETCARFGCTTAELASDIELLYLCGLHPYTPDLLIEAALVDGRVFIQYADYFSRPLRLTAPEALSLVAAASTLLSAPGTESDGPLARGLAKLAAITGGAGEAIDVDLGAAEPAMLATMRDAAEKGVQVEVDYYAFGRDELTQRTIEPDAVFSNGGQWYVRAYCHQAIDQRTFRVDRILSAHLTERPRSGPNAVGAPTLFDRPGATGDVTLDLAPGAHWVVEQYPIKSTTPHDDGVLRVVLAVTEFAWLDRLVLRLGPLATIVAGPPGWGGAPAAAQRVAKNYQHE